MVTRLTPFRRQVSSIPDDLERAPRQTAGVGVVVRGARRIGGWLRQCVAFSGLHHFHFLPLRTGGTPRGGSKSPILTEGRMTPASTAGLSIEEFISTFVTYKYIRLRHPQWLGLTHFVLRLLLIVGYIGLYEILFRSSHLRYETPQHQPIPLWVEKTEELDASQQGYCYDGGPPCREWNLYDDDDSQGKPQRKDALFVTTQWVESSQRRRSKQCRRVTGYGAEEAHETVSSSVGGAEGEGGGSGHGANATAAALEATKAAAAAASSSQFGEVVWDFHTTGKASHSDQQPECGSWEEVARDVYRVAGVEQQTLHIKPAYVTTSWSVYAGFLEVTLPGGNEFRPNFLSETPRDITLRVSDILRQVELYPNEIKRQELDIIVKGLRLKGLDYLLEADELYEYDGPTQTLRQNGLTLALELTYSNTSPFDFFKAMSGQGTEAFPWKCTIDVRLVGYTSVKTSEAVYKSWPTDRVHIERSGIHFIVYQKGRLGRFDIGSLVLVFITAGG